MDERTVLSVFQAAEALGVSIQRVYQLLKKGQLEGVKIGSMILVTRESVERRRSLRAEQDETGHCPTSPRSS